MHSRHHSESSRLRIVSCSVTTQSLNMIQFCQAACDDAKYVSSASQAFDLLFALNIQLNQDKELYSILKEAREKNGPSTNEEDVVLDTLIVLSRFVREL